jgi:hypothetical protein
MFPYFLARLIVKSANHEQVTHLDGLRLSDSQRRSLHIAAVVELVNVYPQLLSGLHR